MAALAERGAAETSHAARVYYDMLMAALAVVTLLLDAQVDERLARFLAWGRGSAALLF